MSNPLFLSSVEEGVWEQLIALYPHLVDCSTSNCAQVSKSLREVLHEYNDLLCPPRKRNYVAPMNQLSDSNGVRNNETNGS